MAIKLKHRALAGLWFMVFALVPVFFVSSSFLSGPPGGRALEAVVWFLFAPLLVTGFLGALLGASILANRVKSGWRAAFRGFLISVLAYLLYSILVSSWEGYYNHGSFSIVESFAQMLFLMLVVGSVIVGWTAVILGTVAGWLLVSYPGGFWKK